MKLTEMTDRERFEKVSKNYGETVNVSEPCKLVVTSANGAKQTTYIFAKNGKYLTDTVKRLK